MILPTLQVGSLILGAGLLGFFVGSVLFRQEEKSTNVDRALSTELPEPWQPNQEENGRA